MAEKKTRKMFKFLKEIRAELKKVVWPSKAQLVNNTITVIGACLVIGGIIWLADGGLTFVFNLVYGG